MKNIKKNQIIIYIIAFMLVVFGYLNYVPSGNLKSAIQTSGTEEEVSRTANIGDAQLVSSDVQEEKIENDIVSEDIISTDAKVVNDDVDYFKSSRLERDTMYSQMLETYNDILNSNNSLEVQKQSAQEEITKINNIKNGIMISENLIKTKGFEDVVIFVNKDSISAIIKDDNLSQEEVAQIQNIICRELNSKVENIHISNK